MRPSYWRERRALLVAWAGQIIALASVWFLASGLREYRLDLGYAVLLVCTAGLTGFGVDYVKHRRLWHELDGLPDPPIDGRRYASKDDAILGFVQERDAAHSRVLAAREAELEEDLEYFGGWIHELKTPVSVLRLTTANQTESPGIARQLDRIQANLDRAMYYLRGSSLSRDMFLRAIDLHALAARRVAEFSDAARARNLKLVVSGNATETTTDPKWLGFAIDQLLQNAIRYTPEGGTVHVSVAASGQGPSLTVADSGPGIPPNELGRVFDRGFTGTRGREHGGTSGMGLYLARKLVTKLGHEIAIVVPPGSGVHATITFPRWSGHLLQSP